MGMEGEVSAVQMERARRALIRRLTREMDAYDVMGGVFAITSSEAVPYEGKGDRFEFGVGLSGGRQRFYEVTVYGPGRSYRIWEI